MSQTIKGNKKPINVISSSTNVEFLDQKKISLDDKSKKKCIQVNLTDQIIKRLINAQNNGIKIKVKFSDKMQYHINDGSEPIELEKSDIDQLTKVIISKSDSMEVVGSVGYIVNSTQKSHEISKQVVAKQNLKKNIEEERKQKERKKIQVIDIPDPAILKSKTKFHARKNISKGKSDEKNVSKIVTVVGSGNSIHNFASYNTNDEPGVPLRQRIIHLVANTELSTSDITKKVCENKTEVEKVLKDVATEHNKVWKLKNSSWPEVRPYEWGGYSSNRIIEDVASKMNKAFDEMGLSPNHPQRPKPRSASKPNINRKHLLTKSNIVKTPIQDDDDIDEPLSSKRRKIASSKDAENSSTAVTSKSGISTTIGRSSRDPGTAKGTIRGGRSGRGGRGGRPTTSSVKNDPVVNEKVDSSVITTNTSKKRGRPAGSKNHNSRGGRNTSSRSSANKSTSIKSTTPITNTTSTMTTATNTNTISATAQTSISSTLKLTKVNSINNNGKQNNINIIKSSSSSNDKLSISSNIKSSSSTTSKSLDVDDSGSNTRVKINSFKDYVRLLTEYRELYTEYDKLDQFLQKKEDLHKKLSEDFERSAGTKEEEKIAMKIIEEFGPETEIGIKLKSYSQLYSKLKIIKQELKKARSEGLNKD